MEHVVLNGELMRRELAQLPIMDRSILWGESLIAEVMLRNSLPFRLEQHIDVLAESLRMPEVGISHALSARRIARDIAMLASRSKMYDGVVKIIVTPGCVDVEEEYGILLPQGVNEIILLDKPMYDDDSRSQGVKLGYAPFKRVRGDEFSVHKFASGMREHVALRKVIAAGYDEAVVTDQGGALLATTRANVFAVVDGGVVTPHPIRDGVVPGVMRSFVIDTLAREGIMLYQESLTPQIVEKASELFICSSAGGGVTWVSGLGNKVYTERAFTQRVANAVENRIKTELPAI